MRHPRWPTGGARLSVAEWRERGYELGRERRKRAGLSWAAGRKKKKKERGSGLGWKEIGKERVVSIFFNKKIQTIQFKFKFKRI